jgi:ATPase family associated with various cellular activities (AAA)
MSRTGRTEKIVALIPEAAAMYHKLILLVAPSGSGKTAILRDVAGGVDCRYVNINLELSRKLLGEAAAQRYRKAQRLLEEIVEVGGPRVVLADNIEMLFDPSLKLDALSCLKQLSRRRVVVAAWNGVYEGGLVYAAPEHAREFRKYGVDNDVLIVT